MTSFAEVSKGKRSEKKFPLVLALTSSDPHLLHYPCQSSVNLRYIPPLDLLRDKQNALSGIAAGSIAAEGVWYRQASVPDLPSGTHGSYNRLAHK